jgi:hypothetical protein
MHFFTTAFYLLLTATFCVAIPTPPRDKNDSRDKNDQNPPNDKNIGDNGR